MNNNEGGQTFPYEQSQKQDGSWNQTFEPGMTLRDYFAAKALPELIAGYNRNSGSGPYLISSPPELSEWAYRYADAMLEARKIHD